jgi:hypothetical protein
MGRKLALSPFLLSCLIVWNSHTFYVSILGRSLLSRPLATSPCYLFLEMSECKKFNTKDSRNSSSDFSRSLLRLGN